MLVPGNVKATQDILLRSYNYCRNRDDGCCYCPMQEKDESGTEYYCAYYRNHRCQKGMLDDAIELLKEQEAIEPTVSGTEEQEGSVSGMIDKVAVIDGFGVIRKIFEMGQSAHTMIFEQYRNIIDGAIILLKDGIKKCE